MLIFQCEQPSNPKKRRENTPIAPIRLVNDSYGLLQVEIPSNAQGGHQPNKPVASGINPRKNQGLLGPQKTILTRKTPTIIRITLSIGCTFIFIFFSLMYFSKMVCKAYSKPQCGSVLVEERFESFFLDQRGNQSQMLRGKLTDN